MYYARMSSPIEHPRVDDAVQRLRTLVAPADGPVDTLFLSAARIADLRALLDAATTGRLSGRVPNTETAGDHYAVPHTTFLSSQETTRRVLVYESRKLGRKLFDVSTAELTAGAYLTLFRVFDEAEFYTGLSEIEAPVPDGHPVGCRCSDCCDARLFNADLPERKRQAELRRCAQSGDHAAAYELLDARRRARAEYQTFDFDELRRCLPDAGRTCDPVSHEPVCGPKHPVDEAIDEGLQGEDGSEAGPEVGPSAHAPGAGCR